MRLVLHRVPPQTESRCSRHTISSACSGYASTSWHYSSPNIRWLSSGVCGRREMFDFVYRIFFGADQWRKYLAAIAAFVFSELVVVVLFGQRITSAFISFEVLIALAAFCGGSWALMYLPDRAQEHLLSSVETEAALLDYRIAALEVQFRRDLENWLMWPVKDDVLPHRIQHDVDTARSLTVGTVCGLLATAALSGWIFDSQHIRAWYGFGAGILVTQVLFSV